MADYRCYPLNRAGSIAGPPKLLTCADDNGAVASACELFTAEPFELWEGTRRVYVGEIEVLAPC